MLERDFADYDLGGFEVVDDLFGYLPPEDTFGVWEVGVGGLGLGVLGEGAEVAHPPSWLGVFTVAAYMYAR